jgi:hypothetical protein
MENLICPYCKRNVPNKTFFINNKCIWCFNTLYSRPDIIAIKYKYDPLALIIRLFSKKWNHIVWILSDNLIIESDRGGIRANNINKYNNKKLFVTKKLHLSNLSDKDKLLISHYLIKQIKPTNYLKRLYSFIMVALQKHSKFTVPTCSNFIAEGCAQVNIRFNNKDIKFITPEDIATSKEVQEC